MGRKKRICVSTFVSSEYGRRLLAGIGDSITHHDDWSLQFVRSNELRPGSLHEFDGFICDVRNEKMAKALLRLGRPIVDLLHLDDSAIRFPSVRTDHQSIATLAADHFIDRCFVHFAYCGFVGVGFSDCRRESFSAYLHANGHDVHCYAPRHIRNQFKEITSDAFTYTPKDFEPLTEWIRTLPTPIGIFCCNDERGASVLEVCQKLKLRVPDEIAVLGADNDPVICQLAAPQLSSIDPNAYEIGCEAVRLLDDLFANRVARHSNEVRMVPPIGIFSRASSETYPVEPKWLSDALCYIRRNATRGISSVNVFEHLGYSHTLVQKTFKQKLGTTVQQEIAKNRLAEARRLVSQGQLPVSEIAKRCGFATAEYFCHCYTAKFGKPPSAFLGTKNHP